MSGENINRRNFLKYFSVGLGLVILGGAAYYGYNLLSKESEEGGGEKKEIRIYFVPSTSVDEPWVGVVHNALLKAEKTFNVEYDYTEHLSGGYQQVPAAIEEAVANGYNLIFADVFGCEQEVRNIAKDHPDVYFVYGSGLGPMDPNVSVFDNWIHEPAFLSGYIAGALSESKKLGVVAAMEIEEVNRLVNAFKLGAKKYDENIQVGIRYINSWFDPPTAADKTEELINLGVDAIYAERYGVFSVAKNYKVPVFGNLLDQWEEAPEIVVTGPEWDMWPTVKYVVEMILKDSWEAQNLREWSMMAKGGAKLAGWPDLHNWRDRLFDEIVEKLESTKVLDKVSQMIDDIINGVLVVPIVETPASSDF